MNLFNFHQAGTEIKRLYRLLKPARLALLPVFAFTCALGGMKSTTQPSHQMGVEHLSDRGSLTSCIENADVASEIEITGISMKKAMQKVSGWTPRGAADANENDGYCALTLV